MININANCEYIKNFSTLDGISAIIYIIHIRCFVEEEDPTLIQITYIISPLKMTV